MRCLLLLAFSGVVVFSDHVFSSEPPSIEWDPKSLRLVVAHADYGRMARLQNNDIALAYDRHRKMYFRTSSDEGKTWSDEILVAQDEDCWLTNADLLVKKNGTILYFWNERPRAAVKRQHEKEPRHAPGAAPAKPGDQTVNDPPPLTRPFLIRMSRSTDNGATWSKPQTIFTGGNTFHDGCWEPAAIELPTGANSSTVHVYFANETPFKNSPEQEITRLVSVDSGESWHNDGRVSFRPNHRDGMPSPLLLASGEIVLAIEDNGIDGEPFKPAIVQLADPPQRWLALRGDNALPPTTYGGAPHLARLPSGHVLLSFQESEDGKLEHCRLAVCVGDPQAKNFTNKTYPLPPPTEGNQAWNSLFLKNATTITAISTATLEGERGLWLIDGRISEK